MRGEHVVGSDGRLNGGDVDCGDVVVAGKGVGAYFRCAAPYGYLADAVVFKGIFSDGGYISRNHNSIQFRSVESIGRNGLDAGAESHRSDVFVPAHDFRNKVAKFNY